MNVKEIERYKMKICAIICEYNPFHNGHLYQLNEARKRSGADAILCLMSGNFVQRGESAVMDKYTRAKHAIQAGADIVLELPTPFATSNAELFAKGAIHILSSIPSVKTLCFGAENAQKTAFMLASKYLLDEPKEVSEKLKEEVSKGMSYAKARANAFAGFIPFEILSSPNNILGLEYTKAIVEKNAEIEILPIERIGGGYTDENLLNNYSSATAIRKAVLSGEEIKNNVPEFVIADLPNNISNSLELLEKYAILSTPASEMKKVCDCTEGLENAFIRASNQAEPLIESLTSARYTSSRIRRIALQTLLKIDERLIRDCLQENLYLHVLVAKQERKELLSTISQSTFPVIARAYDQNALTGIAKECYEKDSFAEKIYSLLYSDYKQERTIFY